jgi:polysaccharide pyruvyl transferase CsaB
MDVYKFLGLSDVFVGIARSALEALACSKTAILAGVSGYLGLFGEDNLDTSIKTNFTCRGFGETTPNILYTDLKHYFLEMTEDQKEHLRQFGRQIVLEHYSLDKMVETNIEAYEAALPLNQYWYDFTILGYYGFDNSGDDSLLHSIVQDIRALHPNARICVLSKNPKSTQEMYGVDSVNRINIVTMRSAIRRSRVLIAGSGNLIQDGTSSKSLYYYLFVISYAQKHGIKTMMYANGIGPVYKEKNQVRAKKVIDKVDYITLREPDSLHELKRMDIQNSHVLLTADPVFRLPSSPDKEITAKVFSQMKQQGGKYFGVSVRKWGGCKKEFYQELAKTCDYITDTYHMTAVFLPMQRSIDFDYSERARAAMKNSSLILTESISGSDMMGIISHMELMIAMRLHALVYAANVDVPIFGIEYNPKVSGFMKYIGFDNYASISDFSLENSIAHIETCLSDKGCISEERIYELRKKSFSNAEIAVDLLEQTKEEKING